jgi:hypothetical protein
VTEFEAILREEVKALRAKVASKDEDIRELRDLVSRLQGGSRALYPGHHCTEGCFSSEQACACGGKVNERS